MNERLWYKDAIFYEVHVRSFQDANQDGIGDFAGLIQRLDYLVDLGITAIWLLPFTQSPLKDDGYDIADYTSVHSSYGTLDDFRSFLEKAHSVGIRVITELVINHTSDQHPWFQRARRSPRGSSEREFYVWGDDPGRYAAASIMFPDFESSNWAWDPVAQQYYWHRFYSHQPDLNFDNPAVWDAILPVVDFWFEMGVDGMRLDAVPFLYEREGTSCEHLPETHAFLKALRKHVDSRFPGRMFLAEANAWPEDMVSYFGDSDECQMAFHFPLMPRLFMALSQEDRFPIADILAQTPTIPPDCQWCLFLRNHDELTLAMVTDQERDAMFSAYSRDRQAQIFLGIRHRLAPLLRNDRRRIELMNAILFSLPGTPVIYYGDEIGMGDNIYLGDRNGVRTPMQWTDDRNAGFSRANAQKLYSPVIVDSEYHYEACNVEAQQNNPSSLLWWTKRLIALRKRHCAFGQGDFQLLEPANSHIFAYVRQNESEHILVVANLSRFVQNVQLDLSAYAGSVPLELTGRNRFPAIRPAEPYGMTLGPHGFYWFSLVPAEAGRADAIAPPVFTNGNLSAVFRGDEWEAFARSLISHYQVDSHPRIMDCRLIDHKTVPASRLNLSLLICRVEYSTGLFETVFQMLALIPKERFQEPQALSKSIVLARIGPPNEAVLCDPSELPEYQIGLVEWVSTGESLLLTDVESINFIPWERFDPSTDHKIETLPERPSAGQLPVSTVVLNHQWLLRVFRRPDEGVSPDVQVGRFLHQQGFAGFADIVGTVEYARRGSSPIVLAALHKRVENQGTAWQLMLHQSSHFFEIMAAQSITPDDGSAEAQATPLALKVPSEEWEFLIHPFLDIGQTLATFTAQLHLTLTSAPVESPLAATLLNQRSFYQSLRNAAGGLHSELGEPDPSWPDEVRKLAMKVRDHQQKIMDRIRGALDSDLAGIRRICSHGKYRLEKLLISGNDFILADFEGIRDRPVGERRVKRTSSHDVATLLSSLNYAVNAVRLELLDRPDAKPGFVREQDRERLEFYASSWITRLEDEFIEVYTAALQSSNLLPRSPEACRKLFDLSLLNEAFDNVAYDLLKRPAWAVIPLSVILKLTE